MHFCLQLRKSLKWKTPVRVYRVETGRSLYIILPEEELHIYSADTFATSPIAQILISISFQRYGTLNTRLSIFPEEARRRIYSQL